TPSSPGSPTPSSSSDPSHEQSSLRPVHRARHRARQAAPARRAARAVRCRGPSRQPHLRGRDHPAAAAVRRRHRTDRGRLLRPRPGPFRRGDALPRPDRGGRGPHRRRGRPAGSGEVPCPRQMRADAVEGLRGGAGGDPRPGRVSTVTQQQDVGSVIAALEAAYPLRWAEPWDRVGLVLGERGAPVRRVLLAVDPTLAVAREAVARGAELLITHHPLLLRGASFLPADDGKGAVVTHLLRAGTALWCGHTNVDRSTRGTVGAWTTLLDLREPRPLVPGEMPEEAAHGSDRFGLGA